jgi:NADPH:quinone reductase-like Zn-dependent oxidoreductase
VEVGAEVKRFAVGDDVFGSALHGAYAEYIAVRDDSAVERMPESTSYAEAAVLPYGGGTALVFLRDLARVQAGERVLIVGASGGVGRFAVQVARHLGAHVTAVCSADAAELVRSLGANEVIDYRTHNFVDSGARWDVVFNTIEGDHFRAVRKVLSAKGRYLTLYVTLRVLFEMLKSKLFGGPRALAGVAMGSAKLLSELRSLADEGALRDVIAQRFPLRRADAAHAYLEDARPYGSVVLDVIGGAAERKASPMPLAAAS